MAALRGPAQHVDHAAAAAADEEPPQKPGKRLPGMTNG